jgi:hypothetical protein
MATVTVSTIEVGNGARATDIRSAGSPAGHTVSPLGEPLLGPGDVFDLRVEAWPGPPVRSCLGHGSVLRHGSSG